MYFDYDKDVTSYPKSNCSVINLDINDITFKVCEDYVLSYMSAGRIEIWLEGIDYPAEREKAYKEQIMREFVNKTVYLQSGYDYDNIWN